MYLVLQQEFHRRRAVSTSKIIQNSICFWHESECGGYTMSGPPCLDKYADAGTPCPVNGLIGAEAAAYWQDNSHLIPEGSRYREEYVEANKPEKGEFSDAQNVALFKTLFIFTTGLIPLIT